MEEMDTEEKDVLEERIRAIETWGRKGRMILPVVERVLRAPMRGSGS